jgi:hypothetical protein
MAPDEDDGITVAEARAALTADLGLATLRLQELLGGRPPDQAITSLPRRQREEVRAIQKTIAEWLEALREARHG